MTLALASFMEEGKAGSKFKVSFNPASLKLAVSNTIPDEGGGGSQTKAKSTSKLDLELVFDSTDDGKDVREQSDKLKKLGFLTQSTKALPKVVFEWGTFSFTGMIESLNETFEFFSGEGVPLRETVAVSMKGLKLDERKASAAGGSADPSSTLASGGGALGATGLAQELGNPAAGRMIAAQNGLESMRFPGASPLAISGGPVLQGPLGASAPAEVAGFSANLAVRGGSFGASASAGVAARTGAFAGLGASSGFGAAVKLPSSIASAPVINRNFDLSGRATPAGAVSFQLK